VFRKRERKALEQAGDWLCRAIIKRLKSHDPDLEMSACRRVETVVLVDGWRIRFPLRLVVSIYMDESVGNGLEDIRRIIREQIIELHGGDRRFGGNLVKWGLYGRAAQSGTESEGKQ